MFDFVIVLSVCFSNPSLETHEHCVLLLDGVNRNYSLEKLLISTILKDT